MLGAGLLSAIGSLPAHLVPLIVAILIASGRTSLAGAGWVASALLFGQLAAALWLGATGTRRIARGLAAVTAFVLIVALWSTLRDDPASLLLGWFVGGLSCGALQHLGLMAAAASAHPPLAFPLRLGIVMIVAGCAAIGVRLTGAFASYDSVVIALIILIAALSAAGLTLYRDATTARSIASVTQRAGSTLTGMTGLAAILLLFIGQTGFLAYVLQSATDRGMLLAYTAFALAGMKIATGAWLVFSARHNIAVSRSSHILAVGALLGISVLIASATEQIAAFFLALLLFELAFNTLASAIQAKVMLAAAPGRRTWLTATVLIGAALGPPLNGAMISLALGNYFVVLAAISAFAPALWAWFLQRNSPV